MLKLELTALRLTLKKRLRGLNGLISTDKLQKQDATKISQRNINFVNSAYLLEPF